MNQINLCLEYKKLLFFFFAFFHSSLMHLFDGLKLQKKSENFVKNLLSF